MNTIPENWQVVEVENLFSFAVPPEMVRTDTQPIDSTFGQWRSETCELYYDYGPYSSLLDEYNQSPGYRMRKVPVSGKSARLVQAIDRDGDDQRPYVVAIHFPQVDQRSRLTVHVRCTSEAEQSLAEQILLSVKFD